MGLLSIVIPVRSLKFGILFALLLVLLVYSLFLIFLSSIVRFVSINMMIISYSHHESFPFLVSFEVWLCENLYLLVEVLKITNIMMKVRFQFTITSGIKDVESSSFNYRLSITIKQFESVYINKLDEEFQFDVLDYLLHNIIIVVDTVCQFINDSLPISLKKLN